MTPPAARKSPKKRAARASRPKRAARPTAPKPVATARARMYRDLVVETAEGLFGASGVEKTTMRQIADAAGISLKTVYAAFEGKQDLYEEIIRLRGQGLVDSTLAALAAGGSALDRLEAGARANVAFFLDYPSFLQLHLDQHEHWGLEPTGPYGAMLWKGAVDAIGALLAEGMEAGEVRRGDPELMACLVQATLQVQLCWALSHDEASVDTIVSDTMTHIRHLVGAA